MQVWLLVLRNHVASCSHFLHYFLFLVVSLLKLAPAFNTSIMSYCSHGEEWPLVVGLGSLGISISFKKTFFYSNIFFTLGCQVARAVK